MSYLDSMRARLREASCQMLTCYMACDKQVTNGMMDAENMLCVRQTYDQPRLNNPSLRDVKADMLHERHRC